MLALFHFKGCDLMAQADGTVVIDTKIDASGITDGVKEINDKLNGVGKSATVIGQTLKNGLGTMASVGAKIGAAAISAVATGIVALTKQSVDSFSEYEQLAGGVKKIFDEMDNSKIFADAANAYKDLGMSANEYLAVMNNLGATFSATMGDEAGYETAKRGLQAISDFASGTGASVDELSEKYKLITKSTSQYQSIADQFSGILPATSADFLKAAQSAGYLSDNYTKLTEVPVAEYQQAVTAMLEQGVDALGLTGNTAAEAERTLSGSFGMLSASWKNLVTGFADDSANLPQLVGNVVSSLSAVIQNLIPVISTALTGIGTALQAVIPMLAAELPGLISTLVPELLGAIGVLVESLVAALPEILAVLTDIIPVLIEMVMANQALLLDAGLQILVALINGITENLPTLITAALTLVEQLISTLIENLPLLLDAGLQLLMGLADGLIEAIPQLVEMLPTIIESIITTLLSMLETLLTTGGDLLQGIIDGVVAAIPLLVDMLPTIIDTVVNVLLNNLPMIIDTGMKVLVAVIDGIIDAIPELIAMLPTIIKTIVTTLKNNLPKILEMGKDILTSLVNGIGAVIGKLTTKAGEIVKKITDKIGELPGKMLDVGKNLVSGIWDGISNGYTWIKDKISGWVDDVLGFIKNLFGIHSPSTETAWMGEMMSEGLAKGILANAPAALKAVDKLGDKVSDRFAGINSGVSGFHVPVLASGSIIPPQSTISNVFERRVTTATLDSGSMENLINAAVNRGMEAARGGMYQFIAEIDGTTVFNKIISEAQLRRVSSGRNPFEL